MVLLLSVVAVILAVGSSTVGLCVIVTLEVGLIRYLWGSGCLLLMVLSFPWLLQIALFVGSIQIIATPQGSLGQECFAGQRSVAEV